MLPFRLIIVAVSVFLLSCCSKNAFASDNGVIKLDLADAVAVSMGGAFVGEADRPSAVFYNPAGITQMDTIEVSAGLTWAQPQIEFESASGGASKMKEDNYLFPSIFVTAPVIKDKLYVGIGETSDFGGGNDWEANGFSQYATIKDSIVNQDYRLAAAYKICDQWSLGAEAIDEQSEFEHDEAINQGGFGNGDALFKATDNAWGFDLGTIFRLNAQNQFGLNYKSPIHHVYDGNVYFNNLFTGAGLGALLGGVSSFTTKAVQKLKMPQTVTLGYSLKPISKLTLNFDLGWTDWSQYKQQTSTYPNLSAGQQSGLAPSSTLARDWTSVWSESFGAQYSVTDKFRVRAGYEHHQSPVPQANYDTEFPDADSNTLTAGIGFDLTSKLTIDVAYAGAIYKMRNIISTTDASLSGKYSEFVNVGVVTLTYKF